MKAEEESVRMHDVHIERNKALGKKVSSMRILLSTESAVKQDPNDWSDVCRALEEASKGMGAVDFKTWNRVAKSAVVAKEPKDKDRKKEEEEKENEEEKEEEEEEEEKESLMSDENVWVLWGASDYDSHGMVVVGALVGLLRRTAVLPFTSLCEGLNIHKKLVTSARAYSRNPARLQKKDMKETGIAVQKKALEHVEERWDNLLSDMSGGGPWSVIQIRDEDGKVKHGPWAAPGHWAKRTAEDTKGGWESWLGPAELTDHSQIPRAVDSHDAIEQFLASTEGIVAARKKNKGEPVVLDDGVAWNGGSKFRTVAVLHMQTTAHMHADERQIMEIACVLVNVVTQLIITSHQIFVRPDRVDKGGMDRLTQALNNSRLDGLESLPSMAEALEDLGAWLRDRRVLEGPLKAPRVSQSNPTLFVVASEEVLRTVLPAQCHLSGIEYPPYLREWGCLSLLFRRSVRCGSCEGCSTKRPGECGRVCSVPQMLRFIDRSSLSHSAVGGGGGGGGGGGRGGGGNDEEMEGAPMESLVYKLPTLVVSTGHTGMSGCLYLLTTGGICALDESLRGGSIANWLLRKFETDGQDMWYTQTKEQEDGATVGGRYQFAQLDLLTDVEPCSVGVMPFALRLRFRLPNDPKGQHVLQVLAAETPKEMECWRASLQHIITVHSTGGSFARELEEEIGVEAGLSMRSVGILGLRDKLGARYDNFRKLLRNGIDEDLAVRMVDADTSAERSIVQMLRDMGIPEEIGNEAAHQSKGEPSPSIKLEQQGSALPICRDAAEVVRGLLRIGAQMRLTTFDSWLSRPVAKVDFYSHIRKFKPGEEREGRMGWLLSEPDEAPADKSKFQSEARKRWSSAGKRVIASFKLSRAIYDS